MPMSSLTSRTRLKTLTTKTRTDNARFFDGDITQCPSTASPKGWAPSWRAATPSCSASARTRPRRSRSASRGRSPRAGRRPSCRCTHTPRWSSTRTQQASCASPATARTPSPEARLAGHLRAPGRPKVRATGSATEEPWGIAHHSSVASDHSRLFGARGRRATGGSGRRRRPRLPPAPPGRRQRRSPRSRWCRRRPGPRPTEAWAAPARACRAAPRPAAPPGTRR